MIWRSIAMLKTSLAAPSYFSKSKQKKERFKSRPKLSFSLRLFSFSWKFESLRPLDNYFFPFWLFEICFRLRFDISHLRSLWAVGASWRAWWPGSQILILILILPMLVLMWPILMLILIFRFQNQHLSHWAIQLISGSHCTYCVHHLILILILLPGGVHCTYCAHHLAINFLVVKWRIENECLEHMKHLTKYTVRDSIN